MKTIYIICLLISISIFDLRGQNINYVLPKNVEDKICSHVSIKDKSNRNYFCLLSQIDINIYKIIINEYNINNKKDLLTNRLINLSNRFIKIGEKYYPLITEEDIIFTDFGESDFVRNGEKGRIKIIANFDGFSILIKKNGEIISD